MGKAILVLGNSDSGLYDFRKEVLEALLQEGYEVHVSVPDTGYADKIRRLGCIYHETAMERRGMNPFKDGKLFLFYRRLLKKLRPAAVLTYTTNIYGGVACRLLKVPRIVNVTGLGTTLEHEGLMQKLIVFLYREGLKNAGCIFFQNERNLAFMRQKGCLQKNAVTKVISGSGVNLEEHRRSRKSFGLYPSCGSCGTRALKSFWKRRGASMKGIPKRCLSFWAPTRRRRGRNMNL